ncbi:MAG: TRAP transporter substrate-binding protein [Angelakisella sp.]
MLVKLANEYSGGSIQGTKISGGSLGGERELTEMIQLGTLEVGLISDMGVDSTIGGLGWAWLPFMITNYDQVDEFYINGWIGEELTKEMASAGIVRIAATENEFRQCGNVEHAIASLADFKGMKIRVPETVACQDFYTACGAIPASISTSETLAALEQGTVDGVDNSIYNMKSMGVLERIKYISLLNYMYSGASIVCSEDFWSSMTPAQQAAFQKAADEAGAYFRKTMRADTQGILDAGNFEVTEVPVDSDFYKELKGVAVNLWSTYASEYDPAIMEKINADFGV